MGEVESLGAHREVDVRVRLRQDEIWVLQAIARVLGNNPSDNLRRAIWLLRDQVVESEEYATALAAYHAAQPETEPGLPPPGEDTVDIDAFPNVFRLSVREAPPGPPQE